MTKVELFTKYKINESHAEWNDQIDNWYSVEIYKIMKGKLPEKGDESTLFILEFLDKQKNIIWWLENVLSQPNWGSLYLTAKRLVYRLSDQILTELNQQQSNNDDTRVTRKTTVDN